MVCSLAAFDGALYAATWEAGPAPRGRVFRLVPGVGGVRRARRGERGHAARRPRRRAVRGDLAAARGRVGPRGLGEPGARRPGAAVRGRAAWADLGGPAGADSIAALVPFAGSLYAAPMYSEGVFRFDGPGKWASCGTPGRRLLALGVHGGALYGAGNDHADVDSAIALTKAGVVVPARSAAGGGGVFRYDGGERWTSRGLQPDTTQLYSIETYGGRLHVGTWPTGLVFRAEDLDADGDAGWVSVGRLGDETEIMNLQAYNGKLYGGTLPHAQLYRHDGDGDWRRIATLDETPDVRYRRAASMVVYDGELYVGTLPSARVHSLRAGAVATLDRSLDPGWHHLAGVRHGAEATLYVDGVPVAAAASAALAGPLDAGPDRPLVLGGGPRADFDGELADVRLWDRALEPAEIARLAG